MKPRDAATAPAPVARRPHARLRATLDAPRRLDDERRGRDPTEVRAGASLPGRPLAPELADRFRYVSGAVDHALIHDDAAADQLARDHAADAVTIGRDIYFAGGGFAPDTDTGSELLAHELTHVDQYARGALADRTGVIPQNDPLEREARAAARRDRAIAPPVASLATVLEDDLPPVLASQPRVDLADPVSIVAWAILWDDEEINLENHEYFPDNANLAAYIYLHGPTWVKVRIGNLARGSIELGFGPDHGFTSQDFAQLPAQHPQLREVTDQIFALDVDDDKLDAAIGKSEPQPPNSIGFRASDLDSWRREYGPKLLELPDFATVTAPGTIKNLLNHGKLEFDAKDYAFELPGPGGSRHAGTATVHLDGTTDGNVTASAAVTAPGLGRAGLTLNHLAGGGFTGTATIAVGPFGADGPAAGFSGNLTVTYGHRLLDITGLAQYAGRRISGSATLRIADATTAWDAARPHIIAAVGTMPPITGPTTGIAITGFGSMTYNFGPWLSGRAAVVIAPDGHVYSRGEIRPTGAIRFLDPPRRWNRTLGPWSAGVPVFELVLGDVWASGSVGVELDSQFGPGQITRLHLVGAFSSNHAVPWQLEIGGMIELGARAEITVAATVEMSARLFATLEVASVSFTARGTAIMDAGVEATAAIGRRLRSTDPESAEYFVNGVFAAHAGLAARFRGDVDVSVLGIDWNVLSLASREYSLASVRMERRFDYVFGSPDRGNVSLEVPGVTAGGVMSSIVHNNVPKDAPGDPEKTVDANWTETGTPTVMPVEETGAPTPFAEEPELPSLDPVTVDPSIPSPSVPPSSGGVSAGVGGMAPDAGVMSEGEGGQHGYGATGPTDAGVPIPAGVPMPPPPYTDYPDAPDRPRTEFDDQTKIATFSMRGSHHRLRLIPSEPSLLIMESAPDDVGDKLEATRVREVAAHDSDEASALAALETQAAEVITSADQQGFGDVPNVEVPELEEMAQSLETFGTQYEESDLVTPGPPAATEAYDPIADPVPDNTLGMPWDDFMAHVRGLNHADALIVLEQQHDYLQQEVRERNEWLEANDRSNSLWSTVERDRTRLIGRLRDVIRERRAQRWAINPEERVALPCFPGDTRVHVPGGTRRIDALRVGDAVWTAEPITGARIAGRVATVTLNRTVCLHDIALAGGDVVAATPDHPFWIEDEQAWIAARDLRPGLRVRRIDGDHAVIAAIGSRDLATTPTYNLVIDGPPTYFVGSGVLVHNGGYGLWHTYPWSQNLKIYIGLNNAFPGTVYVGQTEKTILARERQHHNKANKELPGLSPSDPNHRFYTFTQNMYLTAIAVGLRDTDHADFLEQKNIDEERGAHTVYNRRDQISRATYNRLKVEIAADPDVTGHGYCTSPPAGP